METERRLCKVSLIRFENMPKKCPLSWWPIPLFLFFFFFFPHPTIIIQDDPALKRARLITEIIKETIRFLFPSLFNKPLKDTKERKERKKEESERIMEHRRCQTSCTITRTERGETNAASRGECALMAGLI